MNQFERARSPRPGIAGDDIEQELLAAYAASRELPSSQERAIVMSFLERLDQTLDARIDARVQDLVRRKKLGRGDATGSVGCWLALSIPLVAIAGEAGGAIGVVAVITAVMVLTLVALTHR